MTPQELKNSILQLAIQGKLVPQRVEEGNAENLYQQIQAEKQKLIKEGKIKKEKPLPPITDDEKPFEIPASWKWVRFGEIIKYYMGKTPPRAEEEWWGNDVPWVSIADMPESGHIVLTKEKVTKSALLKKFGNKISKAGTLLMSFKLTIGRVSILDIDAVHNEAIISIFPYIDKDEILKIYLFNILPYITNYGETKNAIKGKTLNSNSINNLILPLPSLAEQKRIVGKLEKILPYVERYETAYNKLQQLNKRFPGDLQKSVLQLAIQGRLVPQRPEEGNAEDLYQQIQAEKQKLVKEGKIKKEKPLPPITDDEKPFEIPKSWKWVRLMEIVSNLGDGIHGTPQFDDNGSYFFVNGNNLSNGKIIIKADTKKISVIEYEKYKKPLNYDTILISINGTIGNYAFYNGEPIILGKSACYISTIDKICKYYLLYIFKTNFFYDYAVKAATQTTIKNVSLKAMRMLPIPLPPLAEQKRIVTKLEEILPLCNKLKG